MRAAEESKTCCRLHACTHQKLNVLAKMESHMEKDDSDSNSDSNLSDSELEELTKDISDKPSKQKEGDSNKELEEVLAISESAANESLRIKTSKQTNALKRLEFVKVCN